MNEIPICTIVISSEVSEEDLSSLEMALQTYDIGLQKPSGDSTLLYRAFGVDDIFLVMGGVASTASVIEYGVKVGKAINNWRKSRKKEGKAIKLKLEHPDKPPLDVETATDEEIEAWFQ